MRHQVWLAAVCAALAGASMADSPLRGDEGMWLYTNPPREYLKAKYGFEPTQEWLDHLACPASGSTPAGPASFVSADGLVMTNHHVGADDLQKVSNEKTDYLKNGFFAKTPAEELPCKGLELNVLIKIEDVTDKVNAAVKSGPEAGRGGRRPPEGDRRDREGRGQRREGHPGRRRHPVRRRPVPPVHVQEVHGHPAGVRPGAAGRLLRRRPGQLRVSRASTSTCASSASTRTASRSSRSTT